MEKILLLRDVNIFSWEVIIKKACISNYDIKRFQDVRTLPFLSLCLTTKLCVVIYVAIVF